MRTKLNELYEKFFNEFNKLQPQVKDAVLGEGLFQLYELILTEKYTTIAANLIDQWREFNPDGKPTLLVRKDILDYIDYTNLGLSYMDVRGASINDSEIVVIDLKRVYFGSDNDA